MSARSRSVALLAAAAASLVLVGAILIQGSRVPGPGPTSTTSVPSSSSTTAAASAGPTTFASPSPATLTASPVATPTPFLSAPLAAAIQAFPLRRLSGEIAWVIATEPAQSTMRTIRAVPLDGSPTRTALRYRGPSEPNASDTNEVRRQLSPDGRRIVLSIGIGDSPRSFDLVIVDLENGSLQPLTGTPQMDELSPAWSPDGSRIAFTRGANGAWQAEVWVVNADGTGERRIREGTQGGSTRIYGWTPDSRAVAYEAIGFEDSIYEARDLTTGAVWNAGRTFRGADWRSGRPSFVGAFWDSPRSPEKSELRVADGFGAAQRVVARVDVDPTHQQPSSFARPRWHPTRDLVLTIQEAVFPVISIVPLDGGPPQKRGTGVPYLAEWTPDGTRIVYVTPRPQGTGPSNILVQRLADPGFAQEPDNSPFVLGVRIVDLAVRAY